mgnify:CR=1 FL=1
MTATFTALVWKLSWSCDSRRVESRRDKISNCNVRNSLNEIDNLAKIYIRQGLVLKDEVTKEAFEDKRSKKAGMTSLIQGAISRSLIPLPGKKMKSALA